MQHKVWWIVNLFFAAAFISGAVLILLRRADGAGHVETPASRLAALAVLLGAFLLLIVIVELIVWAVMRASWKRN